jgi:hypothetical protein
MGRGCQAGRKGRQGRRGIEGSETESAGEGRRPSCGRGGQAYRAEGACPAGYANDRSAGGTEAQSSEGSRTARRGKCASPVDGEARVAEVADSATDRQLLHLED